MPYWGEPLLTLLSLWHLLAIVVGFTAVSHTNVWQAFGTVALGWVTLWVAQRTIGQPIAQFGRWVISQAAGVELATKREQFRAILQRRLRSFSVTKQAVGVPQENALTSLELESEIIEQIEPNTSSSGRSPICNLS